MCRNPASLVGGGVPAAGKHSTESLGLRWGGGETSRKIWFKASGGQIMDRRTSLKTAAGAGALATGSILTAPAISQRAGVRALRLVPHADLANFDPIWTTAYIARNAGLLVWDMLYGVDSKLQPQRQMVESESVSSDGLTWTFRLREGLKFHDGEPVLSKDVVASINRWAARDSMGQMINPHSPDDALSGEACTPIQI